MNAARPLKVVVCGSTFGQLYLRALQDGGLPFQLAGLLANGSPRSHACAARFGLPLYTDPAQLPGDIEAACVVVRGGAMGGRGTELAQTLMARGLHVLQEQPLHHDELAACLAQARRCGVQYRVNTFYTTLAPVQRFLQAAARLLACRRPLFVDAACAVQVSYPLFDILGQMLGQLRPWTLRAMPAAPEQEQGSAVFRSLEGSIAGLPFTLRVQNQIDPADPDAHLHLLHRITLGTDGGSLTLVDSHGPVLFQPAQHLPAALRDAFDLHGALPEHLDFASTVELGPATAPSFRDIFGALWPDGVRAALLDWHAAIASGADPRKLGQYQLALCRIWQDTTAALGYPDMVSQSPARPLAGTALADPAAIDKEAA
ncbi:Gfo/Idh/MocA family oxidoreductase [Massilia sp. BJB1822]|uniref:Gfo/Idh/MocA family oxidoreductase n=1 Tax=Massilia sp. BJB1822 TaxID=2744470 RepID=UPI001594930F|nr:Gfo/Idh/MocA family oxidoreductase [Massilia sp. BJB1822]NVE01898.1 Gfo/Idh/MocA family oxidoreductase [Massilia sp. BJB1822]